MKWFFDKKPLAEPLPTVPIDDIFWIAGTVFPSKHTSGPNGNDVTLKRKFEVEVEKVTDQKAQPVIASFAFVLFLVVQCKAGILWKKSLSWWNTN